ncbi:MAG: histidinol dehydrogenase [Desulfobacter sp.]|nr:MAG: histidinol dehydrogenase [Desulfobacter sp.]
MSLELLKADKLKTAAAIEGIQNTVRDIINKVRNEGDAALKFYQEKFDNHTPETFRITPEAAAMAKGRLPAEVVEELDFAIEQVTAFAQAQKNCFSPLETLIKPATIHGSPGYPRG